MSKNNKVIVLGVDGMDPRMTKRLVDEGRLPNVKKLLEAGSAREDLVMLGGQPTITPPMWTTLSTGSYPMTHGVTCYWNTKGNEIAKFKSNWNSAQVKSEQIWQVTAEAGKKTLVWTWPCSWPPVIDNPNLHVAGGTGPMGPQTGGPHVDEETMTYASVDCEEIHNMEHIELKGGAGCIVTEDMKQAAEEERAQLAAQMENDDDTMRPVFDNLTASSIKAWSCFDHMEGEAANETEGVVIRYASPLKAAESWTKALPEGAKEFSIIASGGLVKYPSLLLKNDDGVYDTVEVYLNKKDEKPFITLKQGEFYPLVVTKLPKDDDFVETTRHFSAVRIDPEGKEVILSLGIALDIESEAKSSLYSPSSLYDQVMNIAGHEPATVFFGNGFPEMITNRILPSWDAFQKWQAKVLLGLIRENDYEAVFTHNHSCDHVGHACWRWAKERAEFGNDEKVYQGFLEEVYFQVDEYLGEFLPLLDEGWDIILTSDHGLLCAEEDEIPYLGEAFVMNIKVLEELGYTVMKKDADGNDTREIDWSKTRAVAPRGNHIYINLKGRNPDGIVDPADKYDLERQIIDDLYNYRLDGKRMVNVALRNKDAAILGLSGPECGDIIYFLEEGYNRLHGDALSTTQGYFDTSVSPIFVAAGPGIKKNFYTERVIREVDVAPTVATLMGLRMPAQCEGAPVYQILED